LKSYKKYITAINRLGDKIAAMPEETDIAAIF